MESAAALSVQVLEKHHADVHGKWHASALGQGRQLSVLLGSESGPRIDRVVAHGTPDRGTSGLISSPLDLQRPLSVPYVYLLGLI
jgi:hypothetical protein